MSRIIFVALLSLVCIPAIAQYPIYPALPGPPASSAYALAPPLAYFGYPYGIGYGSVPLGSFNMLPPSPPSPYYVAPSGREYLAQVRRQEAATYGQLKLQHDLQTLNTATRIAAR